MMSSIKQNLPQRHGRRRRVVRTEAAAPLRMIDHALPLLLMLLIVCAAVLWPLVVWGGWRHRSSSAVRFDASVMNAKGDQPQSPSGQRLLLADVLRTGVASKFR